ncbi:MAG: hypothetical protein JNL95_08170 [Chitinophagales bacterium]|nr:hypothetical protein [Chitinophagales bacterium]
MTNKVIFKTSILLLSIWILSAICRTFIPLEFSNNNFEFIYDNIRFYGFPITIILTLTGTIKKDDSSGVIVTKIVMTIFISAFSVFVMFIMLFAEMCDWSTDKVVFVNKQNPSTKIVQRSFGCGATDSSPETIKVFKIREITPYFIWVTNIDTNQINKSEWTSLK